MTLATENVINYTGEPSRGEETTDPTVSDDCEAVIDIQASDRYNDIEWYRIPINGVEQWINKDGPAAINRTTKVTAFNDVLLGRDGDVPDSPLTLTTGSEEGRDGGSLLFTLDAYFRNMLLERNDEDNTTPFVRARVWLHDEEIDEFVLTQHGYVGGYGPTDNTLLRKFWIYDVADLLRDIPVGKKFEDPTVNKLISFVLDGEDQTGAAVGVENTTPFDVTAVVFPSRDELANRTPEYQQLEEISDRFSSLDNPIDKLLGGASSLFKSVAERITKDIKKFTRNRDNIVDVFNLISTLIDGVWYFEPAENGVELHFRANWSSTDYGRTLQDQTQVDDPDKFTVRLKENTALSDIKPINTVAVNGQSVRTLPNGEQEASGPTVITGETFTESYPFAKLQYDPFYEAAGNQALGPTNVKSDATDLQTAERNAYEEFIAHVEETTEGRIELFGDPMPLPYDFIDAVPACLGQQVANREPIAYSINDVHHKKYAGEQFVTELGVHAKVEGNPVDGDGSNFTIESEYRQAQ